MRYSEDGTAAGAGRARLRHGLLPRLGGEGDEPAGREGRLAQSYERIHRCNLVGMGVLPLLFRQTESLATFGLDGTETYDLPVAEGLTPGQMATLVATKADGTRVEVPVQVALNTPIEVEYYRHGGILNYVLREFLSTARAEA